MQGRGLNFRLAMRGHARHNNPMLAVASDVGDLKLDRGLGLRGFRMWG